jgi:hypothetical protein
MLFETGYDFFRDLERLYGLKQDEIPKRARAAWRRLGSAFLSTRQPTAARTMPWALGEFGRPRSSGPSK